MAKAGYVPFDTDRHEIFANKRGVSGAGSFDHQSSGAVDDAWRGGGQEQQHSPVASGVSVPPAGLDWPSAYDSELADPSSTTAADMAWARQQQQESGGEGHPHDLRQQQECEDGVQRKRPGSASVSGPSHLLHEMKEFYGRPVKLKQEHDHDHDQQRYPFFDGEVTNVFRSRGGGGGGGGLPGISSDVIGTDSNGIRREGSANGSSIASQEQGNGVGGGGGDIGGDHGTGGYGKNEHQPRQRGNSISWQHEMIGVNGYSAAASHNQQGGGSEPDMDNVSTMAISSMQNGRSNGHHDGGGGRSGGDNGHIGGGGNDPGDVGSVEFDPQADCRTSVVPSHHQQQQQHHGNVSSIAGGSPTSWWRDAPEPVVSTFPWDLQLPNPAPPLALSSHSVGSGGGMHQQELALGGFGGGRRGSGGGGGPPASVMGGSAGMSTLRGGGGSGGGTTEHPSLCHFGKPASSSLAGLGPAPDVGGGHRHRISAVEHHRNHSSSSLDMLENGGGNGGGSIRTGGGGSAMMSDAVGRGCYGNVGRWVSSSSPPSATEVVWGFGGRMGGRAGGGGGSFLTGRKLDDSRRGGAPPCDILGPPAPHAPAYDIPSNNPRSLLGFGCGGGGGGFDRFGSHDFKPLSMTSGDPEGVVIDAGRGDMSRAKRARVMKRETDSMHLSSNGGGGLGMPSGESVFNRLMERSRSGDVGGGVRSRGFMNGGGGQVSMRDTAGSWGGGGGTGGGGRGGAGGGKAPTRAKKAPATSRRCRHEGCQSHPNFGIEGDRRAVYCAKHKLKGMVNVKAPRCREPGCTRNPVYGHPGDPRATFCLSHKSPLMVDVKNRCCEHPGCKHQPSFGLVGDRRANFCFAHKLPTHVNIRRARARAT